MPDFEDLVQQDPFPLSKGNVTWRTLTTDHVSTLNVDGREFLKVDPAGLELLASEAFHDLAHFLRKDHLQQLADILKDDEASENDRFVALDLLKNACISAEGILPMCQDTGTAIVLGKKGEGVLTGPETEAALSRGVLKTYTEGNLRYSQLAP